MVASCPFLGFLFLRLAVANCGADQASTECSSRSGDPEDLCVLLQRGAPSVSPASVLESRVTSSELLDSEASVMSSILTGGVSKSTVEIVLAQYDEDVAWSDAYQNIRTVYCKGPEKKRAPGCVPLENVGREGHTYLHHIVQNYDKLSDWTVFSQAGVPTQGYRGHRLGGGHMLPGVPFDAYVLPEEAGGLPREDGSAFVITGALHMPTLNHSLRLSFVSARTSPTLHQQSKCPTTELLDGWQRWWNLGWFKKYIGRKCNVAADDVPKAFNKYWDEYIQLPRPPQDIVFFSQGARFAASRERIRQRPKAFYKALLDKLAVNQDPCHNYFNEWIWFYIIGSPTTSPCNADLVISEASKDSKSWKGEKTLLKNMMAKSRRRHQKAWLQKQTDFNLDEEINKLLDAEIDAVKDEDEDEKDELEEEEEEEEDLEDDLEDTEARELIELDKDAEATDVEESFLRSIEK